jgi:hypothetical protein
MAAGLIMARQRKCAGLVTFTAGTAVIGVTSQSTRAIAGWQPKALKTIQRNQRMAAEGWHFDG